MNIIMGLIVPLLIFAVCITGLMQVFGKPVRLSVGSIFLSITFFIVAAVVGNVYSVGIVLFSACALTGCMNGDRKKKIFVTLALQSLAVTWSHVAFEIFYQVEGTMRLKMSLVLGFLIVLLASVYFSCYLIKGASEVHLSTSLSTLLCTFPILILAWNVYFDTFMDVSMGEDVLNRLINGIIIPASVVMYFLAIFVFFVWGKMEQQLMTIKESAIMEEQIRLEKLHYSQLQEMQTKTRAIYHDMKNQMDTVALLINNELPDGEGNKAVSSIIEELSHKLKEIKKVVTTGNSTIDSLINMKLAECKTKDVTMDLDITVPSSMKINESLMIILLGNGIDNAMEATMAAKKPWLQLSLKYVNGALVMVIKNTFDPSKLPVNFMDRGVSGKEKGDHGHGIANMKEAVMRMGGNISFDAQGDMFVVKAVIYKVKVG